MNQIRYFILFILTSATLPASAQYAEQELARADSLYAQKKYTESFEVYSNILEIYQTSSPQMLLKMAYIKEGLRDYGRALYYLNLYYLATSDKIVLRKMNELAEKHSLKGYEYSDMEFFLMLYRKYHNYITFCLLALSIFLFTVIYRRKKKQGQRPITYGVALSLVMATLFLHINFLDHYDKGIILNTNTYLMKSPSSGGDLVAIVDKGHRVKVNDKQDVWYEIEWQGNTAYIRENNLATIDQ